MIKIWIKVTTGEKFSVSNTLQGMYQVFGTPFPNHETAARWIHWILAKEDVGIQTDQGPIVNPDQVVYAWTEAANSSAQ